MLALSGEFGVVHEPFNPINDGSWLSEPPTNWYQFVDSGSRPRYAADIDRILALDYPICLMTRRVRNWRRGAAVVRDAIAARRWRHQGRSLLMKDPIAFFSAPWLVENWGLRPVVLVRHPAAFASSLKRLNWQFDFRNWTRQIELMNGPLLPHADAVRELADRDHDIIDQAIGIWNVMNSIVVKDYRQRPGWMVLRFEDLASDPIEQFAALYAELGIDWTSETAEKMQPLISGPASQRDPMNVKRDTRQALWTWKTRLSPGEISRVREGTERVAESLYQESDWYEPKECS